MSEPPDPKTRVLYVEKGPLNRGFIKLLSAHHPHIDLTTTDQPQDVLNILRGGFDCLVITEKKPFIDGKDIARIVRSRGYSDLLIVIRNKAGEGCARDAERTEAAVFFDGERDVESVRRLAEMLKRRGENPAKIGEKAKRGANAPIG